MTLVQGPLLKLANRPEWPASVDGCGIWRSRQADDTGAERKIPPLLLDSYSGEPSGNRREYRSRSSYLCQRLLGSTGLDDVVLLRRCYRLLSVAALLKNRLRTLPICECMSGRRMRLTVLTVAFVVATFPARTDTSLPVTIVSAGDLQKLCAADRKSSAYGMCFSFVGAALEFAYNVANPYGQKVCVARKLITVGRAVELTNHWMADHPHEDIRPGTYVVIEAVSAAYPCRH